MAKQYVLSNKHISKKIHDYELALIRKLYLLQHPSIMNNLEVNLNDILADITYTEDLLHKLDDILGARIQEELNRVD